MGEQNQVCVCCPVLLWRIFARLKIHVLRTLKQSANSVPIYVMVSVKFKREEWEDREMCPFFVYRFVFMRDRMWEGPGAKIPLPEEIFHGFLQVSHRVNNNTFSV